MTHLVLPAIGMQFIFQRNRFFADVVCFFPPFVLREITCVGWSVSAVQKIDLLKLNVETSGRRPLAESHQRCWLSMLCFLQITAAHVTALNFCFSHIFNPALIGRKIKNYEKKLGQQKITCPQSGKKLQSKRFFCKI